MGFFEFLTKGTSPDDKRKKVAVRPETKVADDRAPKSTISIFHPRSFDDVASIIDLLCEGKPAIVHLNEVSAATAQRVTDLLSGAVYAINGNMCELEKDVYIFTPNGVKVN